MGRIQRAATQTEELQVAKQNHKITLSDGIKCEFRPVLLEDILAIRKANIKDEVDAAVRIAFRVCVVWDGKPGVTPPQFDKLPLRDFKLISETLNGVSDLESAIAQNINELPDYHIEVILFDSTTVVFKDVTVADIKAARSKSKDELEQTAILASRTCTHWGEAEGISFEDLLKIEFPDFQLINKALESFLR
jgi:hypothetical protein